MEVTVIRCNGEGCGRELTVRPENPAKFFIGMETIRVAIAWPPEQDYCPACERKAWLDYGRKRKWRVTGKPEALPVRGVGVVVRKSERPELAIPEAATGTSGAPEPPLDAAEVARLMGEEAPGPAPVKTQGQDGHRGKRRRWRSPFLPGVKVRFKDGPPTVYTFKAWDGESFILEGEGGTRTRLTKSTFADLVVVEEAQ